MKTSKRAKQFNLNKGDAIIFVNPVGPSLSHKHMGVFTFTGKSGHTIPANGHFWYEVTSEDNDLHSYPAYHIEILPLRNLTELEQVIYGA